MTTLFRKHRPQNFSSVVGQETIVTTLTNELKTDRVAQSYLFFGPRGTGKTTTARLLAKAINCTTRADGTFEPCETCISCQEIAAGRSVDVIEIDAASQTGVDNVRENIIENAQFKPTRSKRKIFIIDEVHMLSTSAFNALLKTLEEPPPHVVFILATTELQKLPATIVSRCQRFTFKKISAPFMRTRLQKICEEERVLTDKDVIERIIEKSEGGLRDAESLLGQLLHLATDGRLHTADIDFLLPASPVGDTLNILTFIARRESEAALHAIRDAMAKNISCESLLQQCITLMRSVVHRIICKTFPTDEAEFTAEHQARLTELSTLFSLEDGVRLIDLCTKRRSETRYSPIPSLPCELVVLEFSLPASLSVQREIPPPGTQNAPPPAAIHPPVILTPQSTPSAPPAITEPPETTRDSATTISLEHIRHNWKAFIEKINASSQSLTFILNNAEPIRCEGSNLLLRVPYHLHKEKLSEIKNKKLIEHVVSEIMGVPLTIRIETESSTASPETAINSLAAAFGGEVIAS